jgi:hypothetical protein
VVSAGDVDPASASPLSGGYREAQRLRVLDGRSVVAQDLGDADLVQGDVAGSEGGEPVVGVAAEPRGGGR